MPKPIVLRPEAEAEAAEARQWYERRSDQAAEGFVRQLQAAFAAIAAAPGSAPFYEPDLALRFYLLKKYPYLVLYRERDEDVEVIAVAHGRRRPGYWSDRLGD